MTNINKENLLAFAHKLANFSIAKTKKYTDLIFSPYRYPELAEALMLVDYPKKLRKYIDDIELGTIHPLRYGLLFDYYIKSSSNLELLYKKTIITNFNIEEIISQKRIIEALLSDYEKGINEYGRNLIEIINNNDREK